MKIYTSYYAKLRKLPENIIPISIALYTPKFYKGLVYKKLSPTANILSLYKTNGNKNMFEESFQKQVLSNLKYGDVINDLKLLSNDNDIALVCYEKSDDFCHRHIVAKWLSSNDNSIIQGEYTKK